MGMKVFGVNTVATRLENQHKKTNPKALAAMREGAKEIADLAKKQAPVDQHNLENAIITQEDRLGFNNRVRISIFVDEGRGVAGRPGKKIGDYARRMHEGVYKLGDKSRAKQDSNPSVRVGRKFLTRAIDELEKKIIKSVMQAVKSSL